MTMTPTQLITLALTAALVAPQAEASNRVLLGTSLVTRLLQSDQAHGLETLQKLHVYLNRRLVVIRASQEEGESVVDGDVSAATRGKERKDVIPRTAAGKIIDLEVTGGSSVRLWISFDTDCVERACAWEFKNGFNQREHYGLAGIPASGAETLRITGMWLGRKPFYWRNMETRPNSGNYLPEIYNTLNTQLELTLQVNYDEVSEIERRTVKHGGWDR
jgi:hypothetical protein